MEQCLEFWPWRIIASKCSVPFPCPPRIISASQELLRQQKLKRLAAKALLEKKVLDNLTKIADSRKQALEDDKRKQVLWCAVLWKEYN